MKSSRLLFLLPGFILVGCENGDDLNELREGLTLAGIKLALAARNNENNLITRIDTDSRSHTIHFESGDPIIVQTQWIEDILYDPTAWLATFQFYDHTYPSGFSL